MLNPCKCLDRILEGYTNFWDITSTGDKVIVHLRTLGATFAFYQYSKKLFPQEPMRIYEWTVLAALVFHAIFAVDKGMKVEKEPGWKEDLYDLKYRMVQMESQINALQTDITAIKTMLQGRLANEV